MDHYWFHSSHLEVLLPARSILSDRRWVFDQTGGLIQPIHRLRHLQIRGCGKSRFFIDVPQKCNGSHKVAAHAEH